MGTRIDDVYYCQMDRTTELSNKMSNRNIPSKQLRPIYFSRAPFNSRGIVFPMLDCTKRTKVKKAKFPPYDQKTTFNPGYRGSYDGYANNVDIESKLHNSFFPLLKCAQSKFIPSSKSDLFSAHYLVMNSNPVNMTNNLLFKKEVFSPFNPNKCNLGYKVFNNDIRLQTTNINLRGNKV